MVKALVTPPAGLPVSLEALKRHLRIEAAEEDSYLAGLIATAVETVEGRAGVCLLTQTWRLYLDGLPRAGCISLGVRPVQSIDAVTIYDGDGEPTVLSPQSYQLDRHGVPARLRFSPVPQPGQTMNGIEIDVVCGFGDSGVDVPGQLQRAILVLCAHWFERRGAAGETELAALLPDGFDRLIAPWREVLI